MSESFRKNFLIAVFFITVIFIAVFLYRLEAYSLILKIYPEFTNIGLFDYLRLAKSADLKFLISSAALIAIISMIPALSDKLKIGISGAIAFINALMFLIFAEFFRIYQTSFQINFVGKEHFTGLASMMSSAIAEISFLFYIKLAFSALAIAGTCIALYRLIQASIESRGIIIISSVMAAVVILFALPGKNLAFSDERKSNLMAEFAINPANELIYPASEAKVENSGRSEKFSFKLNTDSLETNKLYPASSAIPRGKKYNIILYFFESTAYSYLDIKYNGKEALEHFNRLSKNSLFAKNHYANFPLSANSMLSVFTSSYESCAKDPVIQEHPDIKLKTISEILKENGYRTCLIHTGGLGYAGQNRFLKNRKFDKIIEYKELIKVPPYNYEVGWGVDERAMIAPAEQFIKEDRTKPFFMAFFPVNPHHPYAVPDDSFKITGNAPKTSWTNYLNSLHYADYSLGELVSRLESENLLDDTLVFVFGDHGEAFYQHKMNYNHPFFLYEENVHVPFIIYSKQFFKTRLDYDGISRHTDITPTILNILNIKQPIEHEGVPILSAHKEQLALLHTYWKDDIMGVRDGRWKYIINMRTGFEELYDLTADPEEKNNRLDSNKSIAKRYREYTTSARKYKKEFYRQILAK